MEVTDETVRNGQHGECASRYLDPGTYKYSRYPVESAHSLIPAAYHDQEFFKLEQQMVYQRTWVAVGTIDQLKEAGDTLVCDVGGKSVIIVRDQDGGLNAFHNVCRHRGNRLCHKNGNAGKRLRCGYHGWGYDLKGNCIGTPLFETKELDDNLKKTFDMSHVKAFDKKDFGLLKVRCDQWGFLVFVCLDETAPPLSEHLGDLPQRLKGHHLDKWTTFGSMNFEIKANWKLIAENFMEYYHLPWVHPRLAKTSKVADHHRWQGRGMYCAITTYPLTASDDSDWLNLEPMSTLNDEDRNSGRFIWLFPNIAVNVMPHHAFIILGTPLAPDLTFERCVLLAPPESLETAKPGATDGVKEFWSTVNAEDIGIVESVQLGLSTTDYPGGRMCYRFEEPVHRFQNMVIDKMLGIPRVPPGDSECDPSELSYFEGIG
jgi:choline monooxygenase